MARVGNPFLLEWIEDSPNYLPLTTESQNHRMVGDGRDLCGSSSPTPLPKQGHLEQAECESYVGTQRPAQNLTMERFN